MSASRRHGLLLAIAIILMGNATAWAQVLVYEFHFSEEKGVNYHTFETGYFVAPVLGGMGSFVLATNEDRTYITATDSGQLFPAGDREVRKAVVSATTAKGSAKGQLVVIGEVEHLLKINSPTASLSVSVAKVLNGTSVFADNEGGQQRKVTDPSYGSAGASKAKLTLEEGETERANDDGLSVAATIERLAKILERQGYASYQSDEGQGEGNESGEADSTDDDASDQKAPAGETK